MSELQISITHSPIQQRICFWSMCAATPVWSLLAPACLGAFVGFTLTTPAVATSPACLLIILFFLSTVVAGAAGTAFAEDDTIFATKSGLTFPIPLLIQTHFKRDKDWNDLLSADVLTGANDKKVLELRFRDDSVVRLKTDDLRKSELEQMLLAIELWGGDCQRSQSFTEFQRSVQTANAGANQGYTKIWEEELGRRFSTTAFMPLEPGQKLRDGRLTVVRQLAFGGLSAIYLVETDQSELVVLKEAVIPESSNQEAVATATARLEREFRTLLLLKHPNITNVRDYFVENKRNYLMLDYVTGQDLRQLVKQNGPRSEEDVRQWGIKLASVLSYLHNHEPPILHRDFTPDNVVIRNDGELVVIDFGAANEFLGNATGTLIGKQAYISPEQLRGKAKPVSDIYALGASLFFLLTGRDPKPLAVAHPQAVMPDTSQFMDELVAKCTAFEPEDRYTNAEALLEVLTSVAIEEPAVMS